MFSYDLAEHEELYEKRLDKVLKEIQESPQNRRLLKAETLRGLKPGLPSNVVRLHEITAFKSIANGLNKN